MLLGACATPPGAARGRGETLAQQEPDYSPTSLFNERHRDTLANARGFDPDVRISAFAQPDQEIKRTPGAWDLYEFRSDLRFEAPIDPDSWLTGKFHGHTRNFQFDSPVVGAYANERLWELGIGIGGGHFIDDQTFVEISFEPGLYSDLDGTVTSKDWQFFGHVRGTWKYDDYLYFKGGVRADKTFKDLDAYPQAGVVVQMHEQWRFDMLLPNFAELQWNPTPEFLLQLGIELDGNDYAIRESAVLGQNQFKWRTQDLRLYLGAVARVDDMLSVFGRFGGTVAGKYEFNGTSGQSEGTAAPSLLFELGFGLDW